MSLLSNNTDNILSNFPPCLRKNIEELCLRNKVGLLPINLEDIGINTSNYSVEDDHLNNHHFIFKVPYAGKRLKWEVIFDPEDFSFPPDFDFNDDEFLSYPDIESLSQNVPSWANWNLTNSKSLAEVLNEFLSLYKKHQMEKLHLENIYSRYSEEYKSLISADAGVKPENVQVSVEGNNIIFFISLKLDCSALPEYIQPLLYKGQNMSEHTLYNQGEDFCHLKVSVLKLDGSKSNHSIELSPRLEQVLGKFKFPNTRFKKDTPLLELVTSLSDILENRLQEIANHHRLKKMYILNIAANCSKQIIEYDVLTFNKAVFTYNIDDYRCLVTVTIGTKFPLEKPAVVLSSVYCPEAKSCNQTVDRYPYNPSHKPDINIEHLLEYLYDIVLDFKDHKH